MTDLIINGGKPISGRITVSGSKNALLPVVCGSILASGTTVISNVPKISDGLKIMKLFQEIGTEVEDDGASLKITHPDHWGAVHSSSIPTGIRSSVLLIAPLIFRTGRFEFDQDAKGCALGVREIDPHLEVLKAFGCSVAYNGSKCVITNNNGFQPASVWLDYQSVTATETFLMAAVLAEGKSKLTNAACEPHVANFCNYLIEMGAKIDGVGTSSLEVEGVSGLKGVQTRVPDDHHEAATYAAIGAATGGVLEIQTSIAPQMELIVRQFRKVGLNVSITKNGLITGPSDFQVSQNFTPEVVTKIEAAPWPYFPADILPQIIGASIKCEGEIIFWNKVYEGALFWVSELQKFGARAHLSDPHRLILMGSKDLRAATVEAPYIIRVVLGLVIAALQIPGKSIVRKAEPIARAHPDFIDKLQSLGAEIQWTQE